MLSLLKNLGASWEQSRDGLYSDLEQIETILNRRWGATFGTGSVLGTIHGGTGTATTFTQGSVVFAGTLGVYSQNNGKFFWDNTNFRLGLGTATPATLLDVSGTLTAQNILIGTGAFSTGLQISSKVGINGQARAKFENTSTGIAAFTDILLSCGTINAYIGASGQNYTGSVGGATDAKRSWLDTATTAGSGWDYSAPAVGGSHRFFTDGYAAGNERVRINSTGVGVGVSPAVTFHVKATAARIEGNGSDVSVLQFYDQSGTIARGNVGNNAGDVQLVASSGTLLLNGNNRIRAYPNIDSTSAFQFKKADATTTVVDIDTSTPGMDISTQAAVYGTTIPDAVNYERLRLSWDATQYNIFTENGGTGTIRQLRIGVGTTSVWVMDTIGNLATSNSAGSAAFGIGRTGSMGFGDRGNLFMFADGKLRVASNSAISGIILDVTTDGTLKLRLKDDSADGIFTASSLALSSKVTKYNNITTAGEGVPAIYSEAITTTQTANVTILTYTPPATAGRYVVSGVITTTSSTNTGTVQLTLDYKDSQGTTHTADIMPLTDAAGVTATTKTGASSEFHANPWRFTINNAATNIVVKVVITGTVSYTASAHIEQVA